MKILFICDPIEELNQSKDSTVFLIRSAWERCYETSVCTFENLNVLSSSSGTDVFAKTTEIITPKDNVTNTWWEKSKTEDTPLSKFDVIFIRTDPPFDEGYSAATLLLQVAESNGVKIFNSPKSLINHNEKLSTLDFYKYTIPTLISSEKKDLISFTQSFEKIVFKPLNEMGGNGVFIVENNDPNIPSIIQILTKKGETKIIAQQFIPQIQSGDKRILILNGEVVNCCLTRTPKKGSYIGNLAAGGHASIQPLTNRDRQIAKEIAGKLSPVGFFILGIDIIGDYLTEINVTSPTGFQEISKLSEIDLAELFYSQVNNILGRV